MDKFVRIFEFFKGQEILFIEFDPNDEFWKINGKIVHLQANFPQWKLRIESLSSSRSIRICFELPRIKNIKYEMATTISDSRLSFIKTNDVFNNNDFIVLDDDEVAQFLYVEKD